MAPPRTIRILLVEDHPADITLTKRAFSRLSTPTQLSVVLDGVEALHFLRRTGRYTEVRRPDLILLDLNMPRMGGLEVLQEISADPSLRSIPVIVLTTSAAEHDVLNSYSMGANSYLVKPLGFEKFMQIVQLIENFWLQNAKIP